MHWNNWRVLVTRFQWHHCDIDNHNLTIVHWHCFLHEKMSHLIIYLMCFLVVGLQWDTRIWSKFWMIIGHIKTGCALAHLEPDPFKFGHASQLTMNLQESQYFRELGAGGCIKPSCWPMQPGQFWHVVECYKVRGISACVRFHTMSLSFTDGFLYILMVDFRLCNQSDLHRSGSTNCNQDLLGYLKFTDLETHLTQVGTCKPPSF